MTKWGSAVASWLVRFSLDQAIWVSTLARDIVPLSTQVYISVLVNSMPGMQNPEMD